MSGGRRAITEIPFAELLLQVAVRCTSAAYPQGPFQRYAVVFARLTRDPRLPGSWGAIGRHWRALSVLGTLVLSCVAVIQVVVNVEIDQPEGARFNVLPFVSAAQSVARRQYEPSAGRIFGFCQILSR